MGPRFNGVEDTAVEDRFTSLVGRFNGATL